MSETTKQILINRLKSFLWRLGGYAISLLCAYLLAILGDIQAPAWVITIATLLIGELTKFLNVNLPEIKASNNG